MSVLVLMVVVGGPALLTVVALTAHSLTRERVDTRREWNWVRVMEASALAVGGVAAWLVSGSLALGRGTMLVPAIVGIFVVVGVGLAETVVRPKRSPGLRTASLAPRRVAQYVPGRLAAAVAGIATLHLATLALTTATATPDDMGRAGRMIAAECGDMASGAGPYPGSFYSVPLVLLLLVIGLVTAAALVSVVRRPRGFAPDDVGDDVLRHRSTSRILAAVGAAVAASHAGIALFGGGALVRMDCQRAWMDPVGWVLLASVPAALLLLGWFVGRLVAPGTFPVAAHAARAL